MDIYPANEQPIENISSEELAHEIGAYGVNVKLINDYEELVKFINQTINNNDVLLTMGAGDISKFNNYYRKSLKSK